MLKTLNLQGFCHIIACFSPQKTHVSDVYLGTTSGLRSLKVRLDAPQSLTDRHESIRLLRTETRASYPYVAESK